MISLSRAITRSRVIQAALSVCLAFALLLTGCDSEPKLPPLAQESLILAFGDSLTYGTGVEPQYAYPAILEQLTGHRVINGGIPGEVSAQGLERLPALLDQHRPGLLILCHGGNDLLRRLNLSQTDDNIRAMVTLARERNIPVILLGVPKPGIFLNSASFYTTIAKDMEAPLLDELLPGILGDRELKSDPIHPNRQGYRLMAETIAAFMKQHGMI